MGKQTSKIIWFNLKKLKQQILDGELTEKRGFLYLLIIVFVYSISGYFKFHASSYEAFGYDNLWFPKIEMFILIPLLMISLANAFAINQKIDGKSFLKRLVALTVVINIRLLVFMIPVFVVFSILQEIIGKMPELFEIIHLIISITWSVLFYIILIKSFQSILKQKKERTKE